MGYPGIKWKRVYDTDIYHMHIYKLCVVHRRQIPINYAILYTNATSHLSRHIR